MIEFLHTRNRLRFLLFVGAIAVPVLLVATWAVGRMEVASAARGEPNDRGGLHYRIQEHGDARPLPPALAALISVPPHTAMADVNFDTDAAGRVLSASIKAFSRDKFETIAAFHRPLFSSVIRETPTALWGVRDGYEIKISRGTNNARRAAQSQHQDRVRH